MPGVEPGGPPGQGVKIPKLRKRWRPLYVERTPMNDELVSVLKEISSELKDIKVRLDGSEIAIRDMQGVVAECFDKVTDLHSRLIQEANKIGSQVNQHGRVIQSQEGRIARLERAGANGAA